jgi:hypothetical protein
MLLGNATCLAYDIGIFDDDDDDRSSTVPPCSFDQKHRKIRLQYLCYIYIHSFSARYGRGSAMLPKHITLNTERGSNQSVKQTLANTCEDDWRYLRAAVGLTKLMKHASEVLFVSKRTTRELLRTGTYNSLLSHFEPLLRAWRQSFDEEPRTLKQGHLLTISAVRPV